VFYEKIPSIPAKLSTKPFCPKYGTKRFSEIGFSIKKNYFFIKLSKKNLEKLHHFNLVGKNILAKN